MSLFSTEHALSLKDGSEVDNVSQDFIGSLRPGLSISLLGECGSLEKQLFQYCMVTRQEIR